MTVNDYMFSRHPSDRSCILTSISDIQRPGWFPAIAIAVVPVAIAAVAGSLATMPNIPGWYASLAKPVFTPPNWVFGPAWTILYAAMALAFFRVLRRASGPRLQWALVVFFTQIALNGGWSFAFFAAHNPALGLLEIACLWLSVLLTLLLFWRIDRVAGLLFVPYLAWVSYAAVINAAIWMLNS